MPYSVPHYISSAQHNDHFDSRPCITCHTCEARSIPKNNMQDCTSSSVSILSKSECLHEQPIPGLCGHVKNRAMHVCGQGYTDRAMIMSVRSMSVSEISLRKYQSSLNQAHTEAAKKYLISAHTESYFRFISGAVQIPYKRTKHHH